MQRARYDELALATLSIRCDEEYDESKACTRGQKRGQDGEARSLKSATYPSQPSFALFVAVDTLDAAVRRVDASRFDRVASRLGPIRADCLFRERRI